jgi:hypothetical protein
MDKQRGKPEFWVDELWEKHECGGYGVYQPPSESVIEVGGRDLRLISPFELEDVQIASGTFSESGELLYIIAKRPGGYAPNLLIDGILIVARRRQADRYAVVVWHLLFGWALKYLGLEEGSGPVHIGQPPP